MCEGAVKKGCGSSSARNEFEKSNASDFPVSQTYVWPDLQFIDVQKKRAIKDKIDKSLTSPVR